jgi:hypothetical protein
MSFRGFRSALVILSALAMPVAAQAPAPATTAFDGRYVGTATQSGGRADCFVIVSVDMAITGGQVIVHENQLNGVSKIFQGSVNATGEVSTSSYRPTVDSLSGTIRDKVFAGQHSHGYWCYTASKMGAAAAPKMPFDGWYSGISRDVLDGGNSGHNCDPHALTPPGALTIRNGVVGIPGFPSWEGTVSPQGALVIRDKLFSRVDGQIDPQGTIRGQYTGDIPPRFGGGTNCIVKFVWQKE